jgi:hypothetical protein
MRKKFYGKKNRSFGGLGGTSNSNWKHRKRGAPMYLGHGAGGRCMDDLRSPDGEGLRVLGRNRPAECEELWMRGVNECA